jgi:hypothetical protein
MTNRITALSPGIVLVVTMVAASTQHHTKKQAAALPLTAKNLEARRLVHQAMMFDFDQVEQASPLRHRGSAPPLANR